MLALTLYDARKGQQATKIARRVTQCHISVRRLQGRLELKRDWPSSDDKPVSRLEVAIVAVLVGLSTVAALCGLAETARAWLRI